MSRLGQDGRLEGITAKRGWADTTEGHDRVAATVVL